MGKTTNNNVSIDNIYQLDGRVPIAKAIPFGLQHVLAMFVSNLTPILMVTAVAKLAGTDIVGITGVDQAMLLQAAMFIAGLGTLIQLYPIWRVGAKLPVVMGVSFTFLASLQYVASTFNYETMIGAIIVGGCIEGCLGLCVKYWRRFVAPIVSACVVTTIGFSLLSVGARSFGGGYVEDFGSIENMIIGTVTLLACILFNLFAKGFWKQLNVLFGLVVGYTCAAVMGMVDFSNFAVTIDEVGYISLPRFMPYTPQFNIGAIIAVLVVFLVSAAETIGDTTAVVSGGLGRDITEKELSGSLACDGFLSAVSACFGCTPITSFSQNVGLVAMTKVVNRYTIMFGALTLILAGLFPPIGAFFSTLPQPVLGGCTIMMFGTIVVSGFTMLSKCGFTQRNTVIAALAISIGIGFTQVPGIYSAFPKMVNDIFGGNPVAGVFVIAMALNLILPKDMEVKRVSSEK
ncbi:uracil-xanthine permease family protein [Acetivibrio ethanolgignens]|uniref:Uracil permease n=1 Tax=Acetivibrio ethanolgignens TaxID=290052 RepID=A0A0V8QHP0_9FIRM|nr:nucleobase:cation symporter-2 family protein [Acetivibrio ethanolgignens]KSV60071.1 uracil permease [Acetivibrio ethanolgignens]